MHRNSTHYRFLTTLGLAAGGILTIFGCAQGDPAPRPDDGATTHEADVVVSPAALKVEQAERILDRGGNTTEAETLVTQALDSADLADEDRAAAIVALSRVHETLGRSEEAIAVVEDELARHARDRSFPLSRLRKRLRKLLASDAEKPRYLATERDPAPPFARMLSQYFRPDETGKVLVEIFIIGGDDSVRNEVGTFNVGAGLRAEMEDDCPLCDIDLNVSHSISSSDWVMIPQIRALADEAMVVVYYDLEHHQIPARYGSLLPMDREALHADLRAGKSLVVAKERPGTPPILLIAAPRSAMLADVERQVAMLDELPTEPHYFEVGEAIRPGEIRAIVRGGWIPEVRACYETLRQSHPEAGGRVVGELEISGEGNVTQAMVTTDDAALEEGDFLGCVETAARTLTFPAIGETTTVRYPLTFSGE